MGHERPSSGGLDKDHTESAYSALELGSFASGYLFITIRVISVLEWGSIITLIFALHTCSDRAGAGSEGVIREGEKRVIKAKMLAKSI